MRIVAPMPYEGGPRIPQNPIFLKNKKKIIQIAKTQKRLEICREVGFPGGPRIPKNQIFFEKQKKLSKTQKLKNV